MSSQLPAISLETLSQRFERLSLGIAADPEILALTAHARPGQPVPNLLLATVQH